MRHIRFLIPLFLLVPFSLFSQPKETEIDTLFSEWNNTENPGMAMAVLYKGDIVYQKGFGLADLKSKTPITPNTKFQIAGMSKHFTAFAILLLEEQGKLSLKDDIRKYVPEMPDYGKAITLQHLLTLSSGLYEYWGTKEIAGWKSSDVLTHDDAIQLITSQQQLAFEPGSNFSYVNSGLSLLVEVVEKVTGSTFANYAKENIFDPLDMSNTIFVDDHRQLLTNVAESYEPYDEGFRESVINYGNAGPTNLYTSVIDLCKWESNLKSPKVGSAALVSKLNSPGVLKNGRTFNSTFGTATLGQQFLHRERGIDEIYQTGSLGGYASSIFKFPNQDFAVVVLSNNGMPYSGYLGMQTAYRFLESDFKEPTTTDFSKLDIQRLSQSVLKSHCADYWDNSAGFSRRIYLKEDTLRYYRGPDRESPILPLDKNTFQMMVDGDDKIIVSFEKRNGKKFMNFTIGDSDPYIMEAYNPVTYSINDLQQYTGIFYCQEFNATYHLAIKDGRLTASSIRSGDIIFEPIKEDLFHGDRWYFGGIEFERNKEGKIATFKLIVDEVKNLRFKKVNVHNNNSL